MRKILNFILITLTSIIIAGIYGILHDQITYTISKEYYTLFKFEQFGINEWGITSERLKVGIIGFLATWWVGFILGIIYATVSLFLHSKKILKITLQSILLNIGVALVFGIVGYLYRILFLDAKNLNWYIPKATQDIQAFINVGSIHNFGYLGGLFGLIVGVYYQIKRNKIV